MPFFADFFMPTSLIRSPKLGNHADTGFAAACSRRAPPPDPPPPSPNFRTTPSPHPSTPPPSPFPPPPPLSPCLLPPSLPLLSPLPPPPSSFPPLPILLFSLPPQTPPAPCYVITGAAGFIGSALAWRLNQLGHDNLILVDALGTDARWKNLVPLRYADYIDRT